MQKKRRKNERNRSHGKAHNNITLVPTPSNQLEHNQNVVKRKPVIVIIKRKIFQPHARYIYLRDSIKLVNK